MIAQETKLFTHAGVRLNPPVASRTDGLWSVTLLPGNRSFRISGATAFILVAFVGGQSIETALSDVRRFGVGEPESAAAAVRWLRDAELLVDASHEGHQWSEHILRSWGKYEWTATADYHLSTFDAPFIDYSLPAGRKLDADLMDRYEAASPDLDRTKRYTDVSHSVRTPTAPEALEAFDVPFASAWHRFCSPPRPSPDAPKRLTTSDLAQIMAVTFGRLRDRPVQRNGQRRDLVRKTSPSGGSRHPTEGYVAAVAVEGLAPGIYHFCVETNSLDKINELPSLAELEALFEGPYRSRQEQGVEPAVVVIMTSVFERVMWRYREPRTFRTLFMDVGHLATTLNLVSAASGYTCYFQHGLIDEDIEQLLGIDRLTEGVIYGAAIGLPGTSPEWKKLKKAKDHG